MLPISAHPPGPLPPVPVAGPHEARPSTNLLGGYDTPPNRLHVCKGVTTSL